MEIEVFDRGEDRELGFGRGRFYPKEGDVIKLDMGTKHWRVLKSYKEKFPGSLAPVRFVEVVETKDPVTWTRVTLYGHPGQPTTRQI